MTCKICKGRGYYVVSDFTPEGIAYYREPCRVCNPNAPVWVYELVKVEPRYPGWMDDREGRIASGYETLDKE